MKKQAYQVPELRDASNNIIQAGTYGRTSPLVNADNTGILDYINNNLEALHDALLGDRVYVDSAKDLPSPGDASVTYITRDSGEVYYYDPTAATYTAISQDKEYAKQAEKSSAAAEASEINAQTSASSASGSATAAASSASSASTSAANAKAAMNTANTAASSASTSATCASASASNASKSEVAAKTAQAAAEKARDDTNSALAKLTGVMKYAGQVDNYSDLANIAKSKGDVWNIVNADTEHGIKAGDNVAWNGTDWDNLSGVVDLSTYAEKADYQKTITSVTANGATITFNHKDGTTSTATVNNVASATAAANDAKGQKIDATYEKITDASNIHTSLQNSINTKLDKTGTAVSATKLQTARTLSLTGNATGSASFDGSGDVSIITIVNDSKHADTATKASQDDNGQDIADTYETKSDATNTYNSIVSYTNRLQRNKKYEVGDIAYSPNLPSWAYLECITAGTTGNKEPDFSNVSSTGGAIADMTDGNTHWRVRDARCRYEVGDIIAKTATPKSYEYLLPCNGRSFDKTKYPLLAKVFTNGKVPNLTDGRFLEGSTASGTNKSAGLPNIFGLIGGGSGAGNGSGNGMFRSNQLTGAFASNGKDNYGEQYPVFSQSKSWPDGIPIIQAKFDASLANPIYGSSSTVQPKSYTVVYYVCYGG